MQDITMPDENVLKNIEKKAIKKTSLMIGFTILAVFCVMFFWYVPVVYITGLLGIPYVKLVAFLSSPIIDMLLQTIMMLIMVLLPFSILAKSLKIKVSRDISFAKPKEKISFPFIMMCAVYSFIIMQAVSLLLGYLRLFGIEIPTIDTVYPTDFFGIVVTIIAVVVMPSLIEEFAVRGVVLSALRRYGDTFAIICSALVFGLMHASITQIPYTFLFGVVLAIATIKTNSIWTGVILHAINNGLTVTFEYCQIFLGDVLTYIIQEIVICVMVIISIIGTAILLKRDSKALKISSSDTENSEGEKFRCFILSPTIVAAVIFSIVFGFLLR